jgi:L-ascorbate metabolism protein UlaG (beta-lactamase superfamily)
MIKRIMIVVLAVIVGLPLLVVALGTYLSTPGYRGAVSSHFDGKRFINPQGIQPKGTGDLMKWIFNRDRGKWKEGDQAGYGKRPVGSERDGIRITFINHSTFLIQVDGMNILTDPIWSQRTSPFTWAGPKRKRNPGIRFEDLPRIDAVLISHNHYDHLDIATLRTIFGSFHSKVFTPLGIKEYLDSESISGATDMDWWDNAPLSDSVTIHAVPAQHFSGRGLMDRDKTLWCGYVITTSRGNIYFGGDTGYNDSTFKEIGTKFGSIQVALIPIGAYKPMWFMSPIHVSPEEAVKIHFDIHSKTSIGIHFGTFQMADDGLEDPANDLRLAREKYKVPSDRFIVLKEGEPYIE